ncbi:hypothetical protein HMF8227_00524 [Saliniradius amylolyticus]|uniref:Uncharacterized protein n=1 Tax=Saliniradius amylolyticus TaxID=2183582 RepID=A0A2S2E167_9ALTE|nr:hypothetical protein [Saliniradius amylolyticus]AWL11020.1 hypothetical protein HMF8227_00524 [Saliniradius amylolyticus]
MAKAKIGESNYIKDLRVLVAKIHNKSSMRDSFYEQATDYFNEQPLALERLEDLKNKQKQAEANPKDEKTLKRAKKAVKDFEKQLKDEQVTRHKKMVAFAEQIIDMVEHNEDEERVRASARLLGSVMLMGSDEVRHRADQWHHHSQHIYKAVLALLLLEQLVRDELLTNPYLLRHEQARVRNPKNKDEARECPYRRYVKVPLVMAALLQDIGYYHPDALALVDNKPEDSRKQRSLDSEQKQALRKINFEQSLRFCRDAVGMDMYVGNSKEERDQFEQNEKEKHKFLLTLLTAAADPKQSIGNLLKIPQSYASMVLNTRYAYTSMPNVIDVLTQLGERRTLNERAVQSFIGIVGRFPVGFGVTYIPKDSEGKDQEKYEYAIVTGLYPEPLDEPVCRMATKNLTFYQFGTDVRVSQENNLFFPEARAKLEQISRDRLIAILRKLVSNFEERKELDLIPKCWHPHTFFSYAQHQNLWNKKQLSQN